MNYSIIIISKDNRKGLINCLEKLLKVIPNDIEVIVVEAGDNLSDLPYNVKHIKVPSLEAGFSNQRNIGVKHSTCEYLIWIDDDEEPDKNWFYELTKVIKENPDLNGVMGATFPTIIKNILGFCQGVLGHPGGGFRLHYFSWGKVIPLTQVSTCNSLMKKSTIEQVGYFDVRNVYGSEDSDLMIRIEKLFGKNTFRFTPYAILYHQPRTTIFKFIKWYIRRGKSDADLLLKHTVHANYFISTSVMVKVSLVIIVSIIFSLLILPLAFFLWYLLQLFRTKFMFSYFRLYKFKLVQRIITFLITPFIKLTADIMFDFGRILRVICK